MAIKQSELYLLNSRTISFISRYGHIHSHGWNQNYHMSNVSDKVILDSNKTMTFTTTPTIIKELELRADLGIYIYTDLKTYDGPMTLRFIDGNMTQDQNTTISSTGGDLDLYGPNTYFVPETPAVLSSTHNLALDSTMILHRSNHTSE